MVFELRHFDWEYRSFRFLPAYSFLSLPFNAERRRCIGQFRYLVALFCHLHCREKASLYGQHLDTTFFRRIPPEHRLISSCMTAFGILP